MKNKTKEDLIKRFENILCLPSEAEKCSELAIKFQKLQIQDIIKHCEKCLQQPVFPNQMSKDGYVDGYRQCISDFIQYLHNRTNYE